MSLCHKQPSLSRRFWLILSSMLQCEGLAFADVLTEEEINDAFEEEEVTFAEDDDCIYTPAVTIWAFLSQVLHKEEQRSCLAAVSRVIVLLVSLGLKACAKNSGAYCKARAKVPEKVIRRLATELAAGCEQQVPRRWLWHRRHVKLADGTTVSMPDTEENQAEYPQQKAQKEGLGFPIARMMVLMSLATGMLCDMAMGPYSGKETGEGALLRELLAGLNPRDILLIDQLHCTYFTIASVLLGKGDFVARLHHARKTDFQKSKRLGRGDYLVTWTRPDRPEWMDVATYEQIPETITVRIVEVKVDQPGFRTESFDVATTLTDAKRYTKDDIADLYHKRWLVELDIRSIKVTLGMDILRCKTPEMVRKEIWTCLLAYNLIRKTMLQAAHAAGVSPRELSFANALTTIAASFVNLPVADDTTVERLIEAQLITLTEQLVGKRPNRIEPRAVKRRPKPQRYLTMTREEARAMLASGIDPYAKKK